MHSRLLLPALTLSLLLAASALRAQTAGMPDLGFNPSVALSHVSVTAVQPDGKIIVGRYWNTSGVHVVRLHGDGSVDGSFAASVNREVTGVAVQPDGRILLAGGFTQVNGVARAGIARLNADGSLEDTATFNPGTGVEGDVRCVALQADGKILLGGYFTSVDGMARSGIARLHADGSVESTATFNPGINALSSIYCVVVQGDGKILVSGYFTTAGVGGTHQVVRLDADGGFDTTFTQATTDNTVHCLALQADGKILLGGYITRVNGAGCAGIARLNADGSRDFFNVGFGQDTTVASLAVQTDGRIVLGGDFRYVNIAARNRIARIHPDGSLESTAAFNIGTGADSGVSNVAVQSDGKILLGGDFGGVNGMVRPVIARLLNDPATQALTVPGANRVQWLRGGASPEVPRVTFELSTDGSNTYVPLGVGSRIAGGWEMTGLSLPPSGEIRARALTTTGIFNGSSGLVETVTAYGGVAPEITVEEPPGTDLASGGGRSFGSVNAGDPAASLTFAIKNFGTARLSGLGVTKDGPDAGLFTVTVHPTFWVPSGGSTTFTVSFAPTSAGAKTAALHIASNDADEGLFDIALSGEGTLSDNADLTTLNLSAGTLSPAFASSTTHYTVTVPYTTNSLILTPTVAQTTATVTVHGAAVASGQPSAPITLSVGGNTILAVVTAGDGLTRKTYALAITRSEPVPGDVEEGFDAAIASGPVLPINVLATAVQPDGKWIIGGAFGLVAGTPRENLARLHADGTVDASFAAAANDRVLALAVQADGRILLAGDFTAVNGVARGRVARLNADGSLESTATFDPGIGTDDSVHCLALQPNGKILLGGDFYSVNGVVRSTIARLNANGSVESTAAFNPGTGADRSIYCIAVQADGKILLGGDFTLVNGAARNRIARLNANGSVESIATFNSGTGTNFAPLCLAVQPDGKILLGGEFTTVNGAARNCIARLNSNGSVENISTFNPGTGLNGRVQSVALQADGKILLGGSFSSANGAPRSRIARLNADGSVESTTAFNAGVTLGNHVATVATRATASFSSADTSPRSTESGAPTSPGFSTTLPPRVSRGRTPAGCNGSGAEPRRKSRK